MATISGAGGGSPWVVRYITDADGPTFTVTAADARTDFVFTGTSAITVTIGAVAGLLGFEFGLCMDSTGVVTFDPNGSEVIRDGGSGHTTQVFIQCDSWRYQGIASGWKLTG